MPTSDGQLYGFKYVNGHPKNTRDGRQTVTAFGVLADVGTGYPMLLSEMTILTALRTAATSALAAKYLAPKGARTHGDHRQWRAVGIPGARLQGAARHRQAAALRHRPDGVAKLRAQPRRLGLRHHRSAPARRRRSRAPRSSPPCTADKQYATILTDNMVGAGVHINAVGGDCPGKTELHRDILLRSDIFVEYPPQTRIEGEIQQLDRRPSGHRTVAGDRPARRRAARDDRQITLFDSVGFAIEDFSALRYVRDQLAANRALRGTRPARRSRRAARPVRHAAARREGGCGLKTWWVSGRLVRSESMWFRKILSPHLRFGFVFRNCDIG